MNQEENNKGKKNLLTLFRWYRQKRINEFIVRCNEEQAWSKVQQRIHRHRQVRIGLCWSGAAAACLLMVAFGLHALRSQSEESLFAHCGEQKATLFVGSGEHYNLLSQDASIYGANGMQVAQNTEAELRYDKLDSRQAGRGEHTLDVPRGGEYKLVLSDGTRVHANAESHLTYPVAFSGKKREVYLTGEALFEVAKDTLHPFVVHTPSGMVEVMGTRFNVNTYEPDRTTVTLEEGTVKVYSGHEADAENQSLRPGQQAVIRPDSIATHTVQVQEYTSWASGVYEYSDTPLETIVQQLSRWYNVNMDFIHPQLRSRKFAGVIFRSWPLQQAVDILSKVSDVHFVQKGNVIEITEKHPK